MSRNQQPRNNNGGGGNGGRNRQQPQQQRNPTVTLHATFPAKREGMELWDIIVTANASLGNRVLPGEMLEFFLDDAQVLGVNPTDSSGNTRILLGDLARGKYLLRAQLMGTPAIATLTLSVGEEPMIKLFASPPEKNGDAMESKVTVSVTWGANSDRPAAGVDIVLLVNETPAAAGMTADDGSLVRALQLKPGLNEVRAQVAGRPSTSKTTRIETEKAKPVNPTAPAVEFFESASNVTCTVRVMGTNHKPFKGQVRLQDPKTGGHTLDLNANGEATYVLTWTAGEISRRVKVTVVGHDTECTSKTVYNPNTQPVQYGQAIP